MEKHHATMKNIEQQGKVFESIKHPLIITKHRNKQKQGKTTNNGEHQVMPKNIEQEC